MKRYVVKCTVYESGFEEDYFEIERDTKEEAEATAETYMYEWDNGDSCTTEIIDRNVLGVVRRDSKYARPGVVYVIDE